MFAFYWKLEFNNIFYIDNKKQINFNEYDYIIFDINSPVIYGPIDYYTQLRNDFFDFYLNKSICQKYIISYLKVQIICDYVNFTQKDIEKFPILYFEHRELNYTFELTFKDLFYNDTLINKIFFLIVFDISVDKWKFGSPFFKKYPLIFDHDKKIIGIYPTSFYEIHNKEVNNNNFIDFIKKNLYLIIGIVVLFIFLIIAIFVIFKFIKCNNKTISKKKQKYEQYEIDDDNKKSILEMDEDEKKNIN